MFKTAAFEVIGNQRIACEGCEQRIEGMLKSLPGVGKVKARAGNQRVEVLFDPAKLDESAIAQRLKEAGYEATVRAPVLGT